MLFTKEIKAWAEQVIESAAENVDADRLKQLLSEPGSWNAAAVEALVSNLAKLPPSAAGKQPWARQRIAEAISEWFRVAVFERGSTAIELESAIGDSLERLYLIHAGLPPIQWEILGWWAALGTPRAEQAWVRHLVEHPPVSANELPRGFAPWFREQASAAALFPALLAGLQHRDLAAAILDLANSVVHRRQATIHPAADRVRELEHLLGGVTQQLQMLAESPGDGGRHDPHKRQVVADAISLLVALCDALGLIGDPKSAAKLHQVLDLPHRRAQTEAAAALTRLGDPQGLQSLRNLAAYPAVRLRVLAYADELGELESVEPAFRSDAARAEASLASWLADPSRYGAPPTSIESVDSRDLYWPGFDDPQTCYLFRFAYQAAHGELHNLGMAGPCVHALRVDGTELAPHDFYSTCAGLQVSHPQLQELDFSEELLTRFPTLRNYAAELQGQGYAELDPQWFGLLFDQHFLVCAAQRNGIHGTVVFAREEVVWIPEVPAGFTADLAYALFKGRKILQTFNPPPDGP